MSRKISPTSAAKILFRTPKPTLKQIAEVERKLLTGQLRGDTKGSDPAKWRTTEADVADYLATSVLDSKLGKQPKRAGAVDDSKPVTRHHRHVDELRPIYGEVLKDYFLAVLLRRRVRHASRAFRRAVLAGQISFLLLFGVAVFAAISPAFRAAPREQVVIEDWIKRQSDGPYSILQWHPPEPVDDGKRVRVQYRYVTSRGRSAETDRVFLISNDRVASVDSAE